MGSAGVAMIVRLAVAATLLALLGCSSDDSTSQPAPDEPSSSQTSLADEKFLKAVEGMTSLPDDELVTTAQDMCFELELALEENPKNLRLFLKLFAARMREELRPREMPAFLGAVISTYCPDVADAMKPEVDA